MFRHPDESAEIKCGHKIEGHDKILWYKKLENRQMQLLGYMDVTFGYPEDKDKVKIRRNANKDKDCILTISKVDLSAVQFTASDTCFQCFLCRSDNVTGGFMRATSVTIQDTEYILLFAAVSQ